MITEHGVYLPCNAAFVSNNRQFAILVEVALD